MKIQEFSIKFDSRHAVYEAGNTLSGQVKLSLVKPIKLRSLKLYFVGESKSQWDEGSGKSKKRYKGKEVYLNHHMVLLEAGTQEGSIEHPAGDHAYPFSFTLPSSIPSSFEGRRGHVRYFCKATIDRPWKFDSHERRIFTVIRHLDLNANPTACVPVHGRNSQEIEDCCCNVGSVEITLELNKTGYVPGEPVVYDITVNNQTSNQVDMVQLLLVQIVTYTAYSESIFSSGRPHKHPKEERFNLYNGPIVVRPNSVGKVNQATLVPSLPPSVLEGCKIIDIQYHVLERVKESADTPACCGCLAYPMSSLYTQLKVKCSSQKIEILRKIVIGTIPVQEPTFQPPVPESHPTAPSEVALNFTGAGPEMPPSYEEAINNPPPPPSYAECVFGRSDVRDENDDAHTSGDMSWAPAYPYYDWTLHSSRAFGGSQQPGVARQIHSADDY